jgi:hypothetical protein
MFAAKRQTINHREEIHLNPDASKRFNTTHSHVQHSSNPSPSGWTDLPTSVNNVNVINYVSILRTILQL